MNEPSGTNFLPSATRPYSPRVGSVPAPGLASGPRFLLPGDVF
jgi:hypothetical protein